MNFQWFFHDFRSHWAENCNKILLIFGRNCLLNYGKYVSSILENERVFVFIENWKILLLNELSGWSGWIQFLNVHERLHVGGILSKSFNISNTTKCPRDSRVLSRQRENLKITSNSPRLLSRKEKFNFYEISYSDVM